MTRVISFTISIMLLAAAFSVSSHAQHKRSTKRSTPAVKATVSVRGSESRTLPDVAATSLWRTVPLTRHRATLEFPTERVESFAEDIAYSDSIWNYSAETKQATFRLVVRDLPGVVDAADVSESLDIAIEEALAGRTESVLNTREVLYSGRPGREIVFRERRTIQAVRMYIINEKLFLMAVTVDRREQWPQTEPWARRFFDSLRVELPNYDVAILHNPF